MKSVLFAAAIALAWIPIGAFAEPHPHQCAPYADVKTIVEARHQTIVELTSEQFQFLRGIFALNPNTAAGLPYGDKARWVQRGDGTARVFFLDGDAACDAFDIPPELVQIVMAVASGEINHAPPPAADLPPT